MSAKKKIIRQKFRDAVFKRDQNKCVICKQTEQLEVHHITDRTLMPNGGYVKENGISLCHSHLEIAEEHHHTNGERCEDGFKPAQLYNKIGSNYDKALEASKRLDRHS